MDYKLNHHDLIINIHGRTLGCQNNIQQPCIPKQCVGADFITSEVGTQIVFYCTPRLRQILLPK